MEGTRVSKWLQLHRVMFLTLLATILFSPHLFAADDWPREIRTSKGTVIVYLPQVETFESDNLSSRAAVSIKVTGAQEPVFGTIWMVSDVEVDKVERMAYPKNLRVPRVRFTDSTPKSEAQLASIIEEAAKDWDLSLSIDRIIPMLQLAEKEQLASQEISTAPPVIVYREVPAVLVSIDGEARLAEVENSQLKQVINTSFFIVLDESLPRYYLYGAENGWYTAKDIAGPWRFTTSVPEHIARNEPKKEEIDEPLGSNVIEGAVPEIVVATQPTELLFTEGQPVFEKIPDTALSYVSNSESVIIRDGSLLYVLLSGRWFSSKSMEGKWQYIASDKLPVDFKKIPVDSSIGGALYAVSGTDEAQEAVLDAYIPQTAKVDRKSPSVDVQYDGEPEFTKIPGTDLQYAVNSNEQVLLSANKYYACVDAVWYVAGAPQGPWAVATDRPDEVDLIPPDSPVYNVKYVYIYDVQPEVVYVGYLPGYTGTYIYHSTIVYGTGYYYRPWYRHYYYPRMGTWNFAVRYSPWGGWSYGIGYSTGHFTFGIGYRGHRYNHYNGYRHGYHHGYNRGFYRGYSRGYVHGGHAGYRAGTRVAYRNANVYRAQSRPGVHSPQRRDAVQERRSVASQNYKNNLYADRKGDVYKRAADGNWQQQGSRAEQRKNVTQRPVQTPVQQPARQSAAQARPQQQYNTLNRQYQARDRGAQRTQQYRRSQQRQTHSRPTGGGGRAGVGRGGGGRK